jgi:autotransporter-associated beta strand protein
MQGVLFHGQNEHSAALRRFAVPKREGRVRQAFARGLATSLLLMLSSGAPAARAQISGNNTWYSGAADGNWATPSNWGGGTFNTIVPGSTSSTTNTNEATFNSNSSVTTVLPDAKRNLEFITFRDSATSYTIGSTGGNALLLTNLGIIEINSTLSGSNITETVNAPLMLEGSYSLDDNTADSSVSLHFGGAIASAVTGTQTLTVGGQGATSITGSIGNGAGAIALVKTGPGILKLGGNNMFTGGVTINGGGLDVASAGAFNSSSPNVVTFGNGSTGFLELDSPSGGIVVGGLSTGASVGTARVTVGTMGAQVLTVNNASDNTFAGVLSDGIPGLTPWFLSLVKGGAGTLTLSGNNSFTRGVTINAGVLQLANPGALNSSTPNSVTFGAASTGTLSLNGNSITVPALTTNATLGSPVVQNANATPATLTVNIATGTDSYPGVLRDGAGGGALSLAKTGPGTLILSGANSFTGATTLGAGTLRTTGSGAFGTGALTIVSSGGTAAVDVGHSQSVSSLSGFSAGSIPMLSIEGGVTLTDNQSSMNTSFPGVLNNSGTFAKSGASSLEINGAPVLNANSALQVSGGTLRFNVSVGGAPTVGAGVTATVTSSGILELAGSTSALSSSANWASIVNDSAAPGLLVSGVNQRVGNIDGGGTTQVNAGGDLTANHVVQAALVIGGTSSSHGLLMIDASDPSGNPLGTGDKGTGAGDSVGGPALAGNGLLGAGIPISVLDGSEISLSTGLTDTSSAPRAVPEPSALLLGAFGILSLLHRLGR